MRLAEKRRTGAATVEGAIVFLVLLVVVLGFLDLSIALSRYHLVSESTRHAARQAIVHGSMHETDPWGPEAVGPVSLSSTEPVAQTVKEHLVGINPESVTIKAEWLDGDNEPGSRARITVTAKYRPILSYLFGTEPLTLRAQSIMMITH